MIRRPEKGSGLFYHRDSEGHSDLTPPQYVERARGEAKRLGVSFSGTAAAIESMMARGVSAKGNLFLDYGSPGNQLSRPGVGRVPKSGYVRPDRHPLIRQQAGSDRPTDAVRIEFDLRRAGLTIVFLGGKIFAPIPRGARIDLADFLTCAIDYDASGKFRRDLAEKLIHAKIKLASAGFSIGGEPPYGFRRWLCAEDGTRKRELEDREIVKMRGYYVVWLPTAAAELAVVNRILDLIETVPATRIAHMLNEEAVPSPKAGRMRTLNGILVEHSGLWTQNTVKNIATNALLISMWEYGKRSGGDRNGRHSGG
jgi:hypothetical protein